MEEAFLVNKMFKSFHDIAKKVKKLDVNKIVKNILISTNEGDEIARMITQDQLYDEGIDGNGNPLGNYSTATIHGTKNFEGKIQKGQRYDHITLNDSGKYYASHKAKFYADGFTMAANTMKYDATKNKKSNKKDRTDLLQDYGRAILNLTKENFNYVIGDVKKNIPGEIRKEIFT